MKCPMKFNQPTRTQPSELECNGKDCAWWVHARMNNQVEVIGCCVSVWPLINLLDNIEGNVELKYTTMPDHIQDDGAVTLEEVKDAMEIFSE